MPLGRFDRETLLGYARTVSAGLLVAGLVSTALLVLRARGAAADWTDIGPLREAARAPAIWTSGLLAGLATAGLARGRVTDANLRAALAAVVVVALTGFSHPLGRHGGQIALALVAAGLAARVWPVRARLGDADRWLPILGYVLTAVPMMAIPMYRHWSFGSGSWDMGCYVHNAYLASRWLPTISTVLDGADFMGAHMSTGLYLYVPFYYVAGSGYGLIALQALNLAVTTPAIYGIARIHGATRATAFALGMITGLSYGLQSAAFFDVHAITLGFGFFAAALWAVEARRLGLASVALAVFFLFKESIGLYVVGLGFWLLLRSLLTKTSRERRYDASFGGAWIVAGALGFVVVNRLILPVYRARGSPPEYHERYAAFGADVFDAALRIVTEPMTAAWFTFVGDEKLLSWFATLANAGWLTLASPSVLVAALPLIAERFLSSKASMWSMGYHYAAPLCLYAGWGAARALGRVEAWVRGRSWTERADVSVAVFVAVMGGLTVAYGYREPANFLVGRYGYYSASEQRAANAEAVAWLRQQSPSGRVAAQDRLLPHLADRQYIYRLGLYERADWVIVSLTEGAWPYPAGHPRRLARKLDADPSWELVFEKEATRIFRRIPSEPHSALVCSGAGCYPP